MAQAGECRSDSHGEETRITRCGASTEKGKVNEMKYRKVLVAKEELAKVPIEEVAKIAAVILSDNKNLSSDQAKSRIDDSNPLVSATAKAFELLEIAYYGKLGLTSEDSYEAGLADFVESKKIDEEFLEAKFPKWEPERDEQGQPLPVPFDVGLAKLIPKPGVKASQTVDERMTRFRTWLSDFYSEHEPDEEKRLVLVGNMIAEWKQKGIPPELFSKALFLYPRWSEAHLSEQRSAAGTKGQEIRASKGSRRVNPNQPEKRKRRFLQKVLGPVFG